MDAAALLDSSPHAVVVLDEGGAITYANASATTLLGVPVGSARGSSLLDYVDDGQRERAEQLLAAVLGGRTGGPFRFRLAGAEERWVAVRGAPLTDGGAQLAVVEVTERTLAERRLRRNERRFRAAFEASPTAAAIVDDEGRFVRVNPALAELAGRPVEWFPGRTAAEITLPDDLPLNTVMARRLRDTGAATRVAKRYLRPDGTVRYGLLTVVRVLDDEGRPMTIAQVEDVTDRRDAEERMQRLALHDALTDLPGRSLLLDRLEEALDQPESVAVLFVDLDGFKLVNDALGHAVGDEVLVEVAARLLTSVRPSDVVGRLGGDEFLVVCRDLASRDDAIEVAHRVERAVARPIPYGNDEVLISASVGVAFPSADSSPADMVKDADAAMYRAKELGKRRFEVFDEAMRERAAERGRRERLLRGESLAARLEVHYQPIVQLPSRTVVAVEALARLRDDDGSLLLPGDFLDVAAEAGLLAALDDAVRRQALRDVIQLRTELGRDLRLNVNTSAARVTSDLPDRVAEDLAVSGLPASALVLEITEQTLVDRGPAAEQALQALATSGVALAIDDFGTGWASLTYLRRFPVQVVKVDRSFVAGINDAHQDQVIVQAVIDLTRRLGLRCTVEGVETEDQVATLSRMGAGQAQGHLFGRPVSLSELRADLAGGDAAR